MENKKPGGPQPGEEKKTGPRHAGRPTMPVAQRAKQFAPFAAVTGLGMAIRKKERELDAVEKKDLTDEDERELNDALNLLERGSVVEVTYFREGEYRTVSGTVTEIDGVQRLLVLQREREEKIPIDDIFEIIISDSAPCQKQQI